jgi:hypothetical protein
VATRKTSKTSALKPTYKRTDDAEYLVSASQANTDLAIAAQCELENKIYVGDANFLALSSSTQFQKLEEVCIDEAKTDEAEARLKFGWRLYSAGLLSPERMIHSTLRPAADPTGDVPEGGPSRMDLALKVGELTLECIRLKDMLKAAGLPTK